jgi:hypothetical protein
MGPDNAIQTDVVGFLRQLLTVADPRICPQLESLASGVSFTVKGHERRRPVGIARGRRRQATSGELRFAPERLQDRLDLGLVVVGGGDGQGPDEMTTESPLDGALHYAELGWPVLPLWPMRDGACACGGECENSAGKHPLTSLARNGKDSATTNAEVIRRWWGEYPDAGIGIRTDKFLALDVDPRHQWDLTLADFEKTHGPLLRTVESLTGGGGRHLLFTEPGPVGVLLCGALTP